LRGRKAWQAERWRVQFIHQGAQVKPALQQVGQAAGARGSGAHHAGEALQVRHVARRQVVAESVAQIPGRQAARRHHGQAGESQQGEGQGVDEAQAHGGAGVGPA
jgi:hypothetical protein